MRHGILVALVVSTLLSCAQMQLRESPEKHRIYPHFDGTLYLVNGDKIEIVNSVVSITPDVIRIESTLVRTTVLVQNTRAIVIYNSDFKKDGFSLTKK